MRPHHRAVRTEGNEGTFGPRHADKRMIFLEYSAGFDRFASNPRFDMGRGGTGDCVPGF